MKKSTWMLFLAAAVLACASLAPVTGCRKNTQPPEVVVYKPLFPAGTQIAGYMNIEAQRTNSAVLAWNAALTGKLNEAWASCGPAGEESAAEAAFFTDMRTALLQKAGVKEEDFRWLAYSVGALTIPANFLDAGFAFPPCALVIHTESPVDPVAFADGAVDCFRDTYRRQMTLAGKSGKEVESELEALSNEVRKAVAVTKTTWNGRPAMRFVILEPEATNLVRRFSPVIAQIGDGRLFAVASDESVLEALEALYAGKAPAQEPPPAVAAAISGSDAAYSAFSFQGIDRIVANALPADQPVPVELAQVVPYLKALTGISSKEGTEGEDCFVEYALAFQDATLPNTLSNYILMGKSAAGMLVAMGISEPSLQSAVLKFVDKISSGVEGSTFKLRFSFSPALIEGIDVPAALAFFESIRGTGAAGDDGEDSPDEALEEAFEELGEPSAAAAPETKAEPISSAPAEKTAEEGAE